MATLTPNIGLSMPDRKENVLISVLNGNFLKIDEEIKKVQDKTQAATDTTAGVMSIEDVKNIILSSYEQNLAEPGYLKLSNGLTFQWLRVIYDSSTGASGTVASFPVAFDVACVQMNGNDVGIGCNSVGVSAVDRFQFRVRTKEPGTGNFSTTTVAVLAIGY